MIKVLRLLVPTDFSENALSALHYAASFASAYSGLRPVELTLFHAVGLPHSVHAEEAIGLDFEKKESEEVLRLSQLESVIRNRYPSLSLQSRCMPGLAVDAICQQSELLQSDLIIMGTRGAGGLKEWLVGSNTAMLIRRSACPVLAIPQNHSFRPLKKILVAVNQDDDDIRNLKNLIELTSELETSITLVHINDSHEDDGYDKMQNWFNEKVRSTISYPQIEAVSHSGSDVLHSLNQFLERDAFDWIMMSTRQRHLLERMFDRSLTEKMALHGSTPLLALHRHSTGSEVMF